MPSRSTSTYRTFVFEEDRRSRQFRDKNLLGPRAPPFVGGVFESRGVALSAPADPSKSGRAVNPEKVQVSPELSYSIFDVPGETRMEIYRYVCAGQLQCISFPARDSLSMIHRCARGLLFASKRVYSEALPECYRSCTYAITENTVVFPDRWGWYTPHQPCANFWRYVRHLSMASVPPQELLDRFHDLQSLSVTGMVVHEPPASQAPFDIDASQTPCDRVTYPRLKAVVRANTAGNPAFHRLTLLTKLQVCLELVYGWTPRAVMDTVVYHGNGIGRRLGLLGHAGFTAVEWTTGMPNSLVHNRETHVQRIFVYDVHADRFFGFGLSPDSSDVLLLSTEEKRWLAPSDPLVPI